MTSTIHIVIGPITFTLKVSGNFLNLHSPERELVFKLLDDFKAILQKAQLDKDN